MRSRLVAAALIAGFVLLGLAQTPRDKRVQVQKKEQTEEQKQAALVDYDADLMTVRGDEVVRFIGNVKFHHNGAIIECDSALRYDDNRMEFFGKVLISQDSTYIYGDRVYYDGSTALADVYAPIVKMSRGDVTLYTYNLSFNTKSQIGKFSGGGVITQRENLMESTQGEYNSKTNIVKFLDSVALRSDTYLIRTDSLSYNLDAEQATFLARTYIWDHERDFLRADWGDYYAKDSTYVFTRDAYAMTSDREIWADTMRYNTKLRQVYMFNNAQILDTVNTSLMFGDWGFYDDSIGQAVMTKTPSVRGWQQPDTTARFDSIGRPVAQPKIDTTYMRGDSILLFTYESGKSKAGVRKMNIVIDSLPVRDTIKTIDTLTLDTTLSFRDTLIINEREEPDTIEKERVIRSYRNVKIWNTAYQAVCDSLVSFSVDSMATMYIDPILWNDGSQVTSVQVDLYTRNEELDWADFTGEPFIAQQALKGDTINFNQASGKRLQAYFKDNEINNTLLSGNVLNLYYKDEGGRLETMASISCAELNIIFVKREPTRMIWGGSGEGVIYPIENIPADQPLFLEGFAWHENLRPKSAAEVCRRIERPSIRAIAEKYHKPTYAISIEINRLKEEYSKAGTWLDRTDIPTVTPEYFQTGDLLF